jgi:hypothetical protein
MVVTTNPQGGDAYRTLRTRALGTGSTPTRIEANGLEYDQPALPGLTFSALIAGGSRPWRDIGDGYRLPRGADLLAGAQVLIGSNVSLAISTSIVVG